MPFLPIVLNYFSLGKKKTCVKFFKRKNVKRKNSFKRNITCNLSKGSLISAKGQGLERRTPGLEFANFNCPRRSSFAIFKFLRAVQIQVRKLGNSHRAVLRTFITVQCKNTCKKTSGYQYGDGKFDFCCMY